MNETMEDLFIRETRYNFILDHRLHMKSAIIYPLGFTAKFFSFIYSYGRNSKETFTKSSVTVHYRDIYLISHL